MFTCLLKLMKKMTDVSKSRRMPEFWITGDTKPGSSDEITSELDNNVIQYFRGVVRFQIYDVQQA